MDYTERGCCENVDSVSSESCNSPESSVSGENYASRGLVAVAAAVSAAAALLHS
jgi:hypothetical protein